MATPIAWLFEFEIKPDQTAAFEQLVSEMVDSTRAERDARNFEWFIHPDGRTGQVYERYADEAATLAHLRSFGDRFAARFMTAADPVRFTVWGCPADDVRDALSGFAPTYLQSLGGFSR